MSGPRMYVLGGVAVSTIVGVPYHIEFAWNVDSNATPNFHSPFSTTKSISKYTLGTTGSKETELDTLENIETTSPVQPFQWAVPIVPVATKLRVE